MADVTLYTFGDYIKLAAEGITVVGACVAILIRMGYHKRQHKDEAEKLAKIQKEHEARLTGCPPVSDLKRALAALCDKQDAMDHKLDTMLGFMQGKGFKVDV